MRLPLDDVARFLLDMKDESGFIPLWVAEIAATTMAVGANFRREYDNVCILAELMEPEIGIEAEEFLAWLTGVVS